MKWNNFSFNTHDNVVVNTLNLEIYDNISWVKSFINVLAEDIEGNVNEMYNVLFSFF